MTPAKIYVCNCEQCKATKAKRKNRKAKKLYKRLLNKQRRTQTDCYKNHYWA